LEDKFLVHIVVAGTAHLRADLLVSPMLGTGIAGNLAGRENPDLARRIR